MRFDFYKILSTTSHVGYPLKKNLLLQGSITHQTYIGHTERGSFYYKIEWEPLFFGSYILALVFLYGGHVHLINTKKEWTGLFKRFFQNIQKKDALEIRKGKHPFLLENLELSGVDQTFFEEFSELYAHLQKKRDKNYFGFYKKNKQKAFFQAKKKNNKKFRNLLKNRLLLFFFKKTSKKKKKPRFLGRFSIKNKKRFFHKIKHIFRQKSPKKPSLTIHDSGFLPGSISNWTEHVRFSNQFHSIPDSYRKFFSKYKKLYEDFLRLKNQSIGIISSPNRKITQKLQRKKPDIIIVLNAGKEYGILFESFCRSIPVFGAITTFTKKEWIDFPFHGNDTSLYSMALWCRWIHRIFQYVQLRRFQKKTFYFKEKEYFENISYKEPVDIYID